jgi:hypothetical protein
MSNFRKVLPSEEAKNTRTFVSIWFFVVFILGLVGGATGAFLGKPPVEGASAMAFCGGVSFGYWLFVLNKARWTDQQTTRYAYIWGGTLLAVIATAALSGIEPYLPFLAGIILPAYWHRQMTK